LSSDCVWLCNAARATTALAEGISVCGDKSVEQPARISKWEAKSEYANEPSRPEQTSQIRDSVPADMNFTLGSDDVQLLQAILHPESRID
jgi:hypothetical protein